MVFRRLFGRLRAESGNSILPRLVRSLPAPSRSRLAGKRSTMPAMRLSSAPGAITAGEPLAGVAFPFPLSARAGETVPAIPFMINEEETTKLLIGLGFTAIAQGLKAGMG